VGACETVTHGWLVSDFLVRAAASAPEAIAIIEPGGSISYRDLNARANRFAQLLRANGVRRGDRVLIAMENSATWVSCYFGVMKAGAVAVPVAHGDRSDRLTHVVADAAPVAVVADQRSAAHVERMPGARIVLVSGESLDRSLAAMPEEEPPRQGIDLDLAAIIYTSGSTGDPRGVMLTHLNLRANAESIVEYLRLSSADRMIVVLPFYYVYGLSLLHTHMFVGGSLVLENRFAFPAVVPKAMERHAVTGLAGVPSTFAFLLHRSPLTSMHFPSLRYVTQAGGPMASGHLRDWRAAMPQVPFYVMYGATEASARLSFLDPSEVDRRRGSIGKAIPNVELRVVTDEGRTAAPGQVGELVARGSNISPGYWNNPDETRAAFGPGGYRTGDLAYADEDGYLYLVGRRQDMLKVGAHRVGAKEIEDVLSEHESVHEVAVVGEAHELLGEVPVAIVTARGGAVDVPNVLAFCRSRLAAHKTPSRIIVRDELPKTGAGKIDKRQLREWLQMETVSVEAGRK
jgi:amino acid adenylation domain-containing protein